MMIPPVPSYPIPTDPSQSLITAGRSAGRSVTFWNPIFDAKVVKWGVCECGVLYLARLVPYLSLFPNFPNLDS